MSFPRTCRRPYCFPIILTIILILHPFHLLYAINGAFTVELIRRRSPKLLSLSSSSSSRAHSPVHAYLGHYLMELSLGTPPVDIYGIVDTGSDLIWTQCLPCDPCYTQSNPIFDPHSSLTYTPISCTSPHCHLLDPSARACSPPTHPLCNYTYAYASSAITQGVLAQDTLTFTAQDDAVVSLDGLVFGCGHRDTGPFNDHEMGIIGLGGGPLSLISQLGSSFGLSRFFSQCLVPFHSDVNISSTMSFGGHASEGELSGDDVVSTPLIAKQDKTFYYVTLEGISVGNTYLRFNTNAISKGNMFIDSGTPPTILPQDLYDRVVEEVRRQVTSLKPIQDDPEFGAQLCYRTESNLDGPNLTAHFEGGIVELGPMQMFIPPKDGVFCLAMTNTSSDVGVYGNFAQSNYLIGFDLERQVVSFKPTDCTKQ